MKILYRTCAVELRWWILLGIPSSSYLISDSLRSRSAIPYLQASWSPFPYSSSSIIHRPIQIGAVPTIVRKAPQAVSPQPNPPDHGADADRDDDDDDGGGELVEEADQGGAGGEEKCVLGGREKRPQRAEEGVHLQVSCAEKFGEVATATFDRESSVRAPHPPLPSRSSQGLTPRRLFVLLPSLSRAGVPASPRAARWTNGSTAALKTPGTSLCSTCS